MRALSDGADVKMKKALKKIIQNKKDSFIKIVAPKVVTALANVVRMGPRIIFRSTIELMRANLITRILSCISLLVIDIIDLVRKRISTLQFVKNVALSALLVITGTIGWDLGSRWIVLEFFGGFVDIAGGVIGAGVLSFTSNFVLDKASGKLIETDAQKMWKLLAPHIDTLADEEQEHVRERITCSCLKKMYASADREAYAKLLIKKILAKEKIPGQLRAEQHAPRRR